MIAVKAERKQQRAVQRIGEREQVDGCIGAKLCHVAQLPNHAATALAPRTHDPKMQRMLIFTAEGRRSVDERDVIAVYRGGGDGRYTFCTLALHGGTEISGAVLNAAIDRIEREIAEAPEAA